MGAGDEYDEKKPSRRELLTLCKKGSDSGAAEGSGSDSGAAGGSDSDSVKYYRPRRPRILDERGRPQVQSGSEERSKSAHEFRWLDSETSREGEREV